MKAWMLCIVMVTGMTETTNAGGKLDLGSMIDQSETEIAQAHGKVVKRLPSADTVGFYQNDWLRLRQRKRFAIAQAEIKLKKQRP